MENDTNSDIDLIIDTPPEEEPAFTSDDLDGVSEAPSFSSESEKEEKVLSDEFHDNGSTLENLSNSAVHRNYFAYLTEDLLVRKTLRRNIGYMIFIFVLCLFYITLRYYYEKEQILNVELENKLTDRRYRALTVSSELKDATLPSRIEANLTDTALHRTSKPLYEFSVPSSE